MAVERRAQSHDRVQGVTAVILSCRRPRVLAEVLGRLRDEPLEEIIIVEHGGELPPDLGAAGPPVHVISPGRNLGAPGRNLAARQARGEYLLMLDDDSYPYPGTVERMVELMDADPRLGALGGLVVDVDAGTEVTTGREPGSFDWFLRGDGAPAGSTPSFFFPECGSLLRREAFLAVGGCFEPYFMMMTELDIATRLIAAGWDVRYAPDTRFGHRRHEEWRLDPERMLRYRIRNQLWYFWLRFPLHLAVRRIVAYLAFDLLEAYYRGMLRAWAGGIRDAVRERAAIRGMRAPLPRSVVRRAELNRGRLHLRLTAIGIARRLRRLAGTAGTGAGAPHRPVARR